MSLRLRLALWYGVLTGLVVLLCGILMYAVQTRSHYDDLDRTLVNTAAHLRNDLKAGDQTRRPLAAPMAPDVILRLYSQDGRLLAAPALAQLAPPVNTRSILNRSSERPFDPLVGLAPQILSVPEGVGRFGVLRAGQGNRWRVYVLPVHGYTQDIAALAPLNRLDDAMIRGRTLVFLITLGGLAVALLASFLIASRALRPVAVLTETARNIARSRSFRQRVPIGNERDEMGRMAVTFNEMLANLEQAYQIQQRFVADASHELRAPLTAIQANLELLEREAPMPAEARDEAVHEANREAHRLARLVGDLLALARADAGLALPKERVDLDRVLLEALRDVQHLVKGQRIEVETLEPTAVRGDEDRLKQLFFVLLDNALKYTPPNGRVGISLRQGGGMVTTTISDTGVGIPAPDVPHVFERFFRADPGRARDPGGTGLGLAIALWTVEQHNGEISLVSDVGQGTKVTVQLPIAS